MTHGESNFENLYFHRLNNTNSARTASSIAQFIGLANTPRCLFSFPDYAPRRIFLFCSRQKFKRKKNEMKRKSLTNINEKHFKILPDRFNCVRLRICSRWKLVIRNKHDSLVLVLILVRNHLRAMKNVEIFFRIRYAYKLFMINVIKHQMNVI